MSDKVRCFVYGTLRQGDYNHGRLGMEDGFVPATAQGRIYHHNPSFRMYPVAKFDEEGTIVGEVVEFDPGRWGYVHAMERGAGYELRLVDVQYEDGSAEEVCAWHYPGTPGGPQIESGDWFDDDLE